MKYVVARVEDVPEGKSMVVEIGGRSVGVFNISGTFHALLNRCPHRGGPLCVGDIVSFCESERPGDYRFSESKKMVACPWHAWEFDIATGQSYVDPARLRVRPFPVEVQDGGTVAMGSDPQKEGGPLEGPYVVDVYPVSIEDSYVVVTMPNQKPRP